MALDLSQTRPQLTAEWPLSLLAGSVEEGQGLQFLIENGTNVVTPGTGAANTNIFAGVALSYFTSPTTGVAVDVVTLDSSGNGVLSNTPVSSSVISAFLSPTLDTGTGDLQDGQYVGGTALSWVTSAPDATHFTFTGTAFSSNASNTGLVVKVIYRYTLTAQQAAALVGDGIAGHTVPSDVTGTIGVIQRGIVFTSNFDVSANWGAADISTIKLATNGLFQVGGTGASVNADVYSVPSASSPYLGLYLRG